MIGLTGHHDSGAVTACSVGPAWRERQTELHAELRRDALLTLRTVLRRHLHDESLYLNGNAGSPPLT
jgi:hypothetical protein